MQILVGVQVGGQANAVKACGLGTLMLREDAGEGWKDDMCIRDPVSHAWGCILYAYIGLPRVVFLPKVKRQRGTAGRALPQLNEAMRRNLSSVVDQFLPLYGVGKRNIVLTIDFPRNF